MPATGTNRRRRAQSVVEFSIILPLLLLLILGVIELGYMLFVYVQLQNAAREGARSAAVRPCPTQQDINRIIADTRERIAAFVDTNTITPSITWSADENGNLRWRYTDPVTVSLNYTLEPLDPIVGAFIPQIEINAIASRSITTDCDIASVVRATPTPSNTPTHTPTPSNTPTPSATDRKSVV